MVFKTKKLSNALDRQLKDLMTHFLGKVPVVFKTKKLSNALNKQLKNLMTHFLGKVPVV